VKCIISLDTDSFSTLELSYTHFTYGTSEVLWQLAVHTGHY